MTRKNVLVLGGSGMLGSMLVDHLSRDESMSVSATMRNATALQDFAELYPAVGWSVADVEAGGSGLFDSFDGQHWIINAIGITKPLIHDDNQFEIRRATHINALLPDEIAKQAQQRGARVIQIATDCVFSGAKGSYTETDSHDALDVYGKTKSLGECFFENVHHLRCSIIGPEPKDYKFLIEWFRRQAKRASVNGFVNHQWNGVTTLHFAKLCQGIVQQDTALGHVQHVVPTASVSKAQMLHDFASAFGRPDINLHDVEAKTVIDRTLATNHAERNIALWRAAGYDSPPSVSEMILELGRHEYKPDATRR
jgi:dTDP-4-dehydrorhamnose reductase